jgi:hypothetical protein
MAGASNLARVRCFPGQLVKKARLDAEEAFGEEPIPLEALADAARFDDQPLVLAECCLKMSRCGVGRPV